jgi:hypothetical protein
MSISGGLRGSDLDKLTVAIAKEANSRIGSELVRQVLIQQLNFVPKEDIRTNWIGDDECAVEADSG